MRGSIVLAVVSLVVVGGACGGGDDDATSTQPASTASPASPASTVNATSPDTTAGPVPTAPPLDEIEDPALRDELLAMLAEDQRVRSSLEIPPDADEVDDHNQTRLAEIFDEHGWPGWSLVGEDGSTAAWAIAQHADLDLAFQERALALLEEAAAAGDASKGDLAYLTDRVLVAKGEPQVYGTQWGSAPDGTPEPRTPIVDEANVDARRAEAGLSTLDEYLKELEAAFGG